MNILIARIESLVRRIAEEKTGRKRTETMGRILVLLELLKERISE